MSRGPDNQLAVDVARHMMKDWLGLCRGPIRTLRLATVELRVYETLVVTLRIGNPHPGFGRDQLQLFKFMDREICATPTGRLVSGNRTSEVTFTVIRAGPRERYCTITTKGMVCYHRCDGKHCSFPSYHTSVS